MAFVFNWTSHPKWTGLEPDIYPNIAYDTHRNTYAMTCSQISECSFQETQTTQEAAIFWHLLCWITHQIQPNKTQFDYFCALTDREIKNQNQNLKKWVGAKRNQIKVIYLSPALTPVVLQCILLSGLIFIIPISKFQLKLIYVNN